MKLNFTRLCTAAVMLCVLGAGPAAATGAGSEPDNNPPASRSLFRKSKARTSRKNNAVRIYPDPVRRAIHVVAKENKGREIDFFVFDLQGTLMEHLRLDGGDHEKLTDLGRGKYIYRVFTGDTETASGDFDVR